MAATVPLPLLIRAWRRGRLLPILRDAAAEQFAVEAAEEAGLAVSENELQIAADRWRQSIGLNSANKTQAWLDREGLDAFDLQSVLETDLLIDKLKSHLAGQLGEAHFATASDRFARARLRMLVAPSEGEARERIASVHEEGRDFAEMARLHSLHLSSRPAGGDLGEVFRCHLPVPVADAVFAARPGDVVGPFAGEGGFHVFLVESVQPPSLVDRATAALVRAEVFGNWLRRRLAEFRVDMSWSSES